MNFFRNLSSIPRASSNFAGMASARAFSTTPVARSNVARMTLVGRVGSDIAVNNSKNNRSYIQYSLAVNTSKDHTSWFKIVVFDPNQLQFMENYVRKGNLVYVEASASQQVYTAENERKITTLQLVQQSITKIKTKAPSSEEGEAVENAEAVEGSEEQQPHA